MKLIESKEALQSWEDYQEFLKLQLKLLEGPGAPFLVSKEKVRFESEGKAWNGHAVLAGPKGPNCARKLQKEGVLFREGTCGKEGKQLQVDGLDSKLVREAAKTITKLLLGYKIAGLEEDEEEPASSAASAGAGEGTSGASATAPEVRVKKVDELKKLGTDIERLLAALNK